MSDRLITLRTGQIRRVSDHEVDVAVIVARDIVDRIGPSKADDLDDRQRLAIALIAIVDGEVRS